MNWPVSSVLWDLQLTKCFVQPRDSSDAPSPRMVPNSFTLLLPYLDAWAAWLANIYSSKTSQQFAWKCLVLLFQFNQRQPFGWWEGKHCFWMVWFLQADQTAFDAHIRSEIPPAIKGHLEIAKSSLQWATSLESLSQHHSAAAAASP